jgi:tRNA G10  N-methylase Trm11
MGDYTVTIETLFRIAMCRLKLGGRLVFWMPTSGTATLDELVQTLHGILSATMPHQQSTYMAFIRATPQYLNSRLTRWMCVFEKNSAVL